MKATLDKKKDKIYQLHDVNKWELTPSEASTVTKEILYDKTEAFKFMLPKETAMQEKMKMKLFYLIQQIFYQGIRNTHRMTVKYCENFKDFSVSLKVNHQQMCEMWMEMSKNFSGPR